jgi:fumarate reductase flavoprotein subunit
MPICAAITNTMGGILVDGHGRVLDKNDKPIPGLYAAGSTVGGLDGGPHAGYVGGLIKAVIGLLAAEAIAS